MDNEGPSRFRGVGWTALVFFLRFLSASVVLYLIYTKTGAHYMRFVANGAKPLMSLFGLEMNLQRALRVTEEISLNPVVFLSLVIATQRVPALKRTVAGIIGFAILTAANTLTVFLLFMSAHRGSEILWTGTEFFNLTMNFFFPILLWIVLLPSAAFSTMRGTVSGRSEQQQRRRNTGHNSNG